MKYNKDFTAFEEEVSWLIKPNSNLLIKENYLKLSDEFKNTFPKLNSLIEKARISCIEIDDQDYILFAWDNKQNQICGWFNKIENKETNFLEIITEHDLLLKNIGGIQESFNN